MKGQLDLFREQNLEQVRALRVLLRPSTLLEAECGECNQRDAISVSTEELYRYKDGALVQDVWPKMPAAHREIIRGAVTRIYVCDSCWHKFDEGG